MHTKKIAAELHPHLPSGEWEGFYTYHMGPDAEQHPMHFTLNFNNDIILGNGSDDVGGFSWKGFYDKTGMTCGMTKAYISHEVSYQGNIDEQGIWGTWTMAFMKGGFHIWPKTKAAEEKVVAKKTKKNTLLTKV